MKNMLLLGVICLCLSSVNAQNDSSLQLWAAVPGFDCQTSGCQSDTGAKIAANLKTEMRNTKRIRIFDNEALTDLRFVGIITDIKSSKLSILGVVNQTVDITVTLQALDWRTTEVIWSGRATGHSETTNLSLVSSSTLSLDSALQDSSTNLVKAIMASDDLKTYFKHKVGEVPTAATTPAAPTTTTPATTTAATTPTAPNTTTTAAATASTSAKGAVDGFIAALNTLDYAALNSSLSTIVYNPLQLQAAQQAATDANKKALASLVGFAVTPADAGNAAFQSWDVVYTLPGAAAKVARLLTLNDTGGKITGRVGWTVLYFAPGNPYRSVVGGGLNFELPSVAVEVLLGDFNAALGIVLPR